MNISQAMVNREKKFMRPIASFVLILAMSFSNTPIGFFDYLAGKWHDRNVVDLLWLAENDSSVVDLLITERVYAGDGFVPAVYQSSFQAQGSAGTQTISGVGFTPSAVLFYWTEQAAEGTDTAGDNASVGVGFTTGTANERAASYWTETAGSADTGRYGAISAMIAVQNGLNGTLLNVAELDSFNSDGFVVNWTTANAAQHIVHYVAFNSEVVTDAVAETFSLTTGTGNLSVTNAGFQPEFVMFISAMTSTSDTNTAEGGIMVGAAQSSSAEWVTTIRSEDAGTSADTCIQQRTDNSIAFIAHDGGANDCNVQDALADFTQFTADGVDLNQSDAPAVARDVFYLALAGPDFAVGNLTSPTSAGNQSVNSLSFRPDGLFFAGFGIAATTAVTANTLGGFSLGSAASTSASNAQGAVAVTDTDADSSPDPDPRTVTTAAYTEIETATPSQEAEADLVTMNSDGFTLDWTNVDETGNQVLWWAISEGDAIPIAEPPTVTTNFATPGFNSAMLHGTKTGGDNATQHGFAYSTDSSLSSSVTTTTLGVLNSNSSFSNFITGLSSDETYFFRAYATNNGGTGYGTIKGFLTGNSSAQRNTRLFGRVNFLNGRLILNQLGSFVGGGGGSAPTVTTDANATTKGTWLGADWMYVGGNITSIGGDAPTVRGFAFGNNCPGLQDICTSTTTENGTFGTGAFPSPVDCTMSNDTSEDIYYRAYATNSFGTGYGTIESDTPGGANSDCAGGG